MENQTITVENKMSTLTKILIAMVIGLILYIIIKDAINRPVKDKIDPKTVYNYKPEIIYVDKPYPVYPKTDAQKASDKINPLLLEKFKQLEAKFDGITFNEHETAISFTRDTTKYQYIYNNKFLEQYPEKSKLIDFRLSLDSLKIALLNTEGETERKTYPLYFSDFEYYWADNELHKSQIKHKKENKFWAKTNWNQLYLNGGYSALVKKPLAGLEYNLSVWRFKLDLNTEMIIQEKPDLFVSAKLGYRLFQ